MASHTVDAIDARSLAKILGAMGLLWGLIVAITGLVAGFLGAGAFGFSELAVSIVGGPLYGAVVGAITAIVYNAAASLIGGVELELS